MLLSTSSAAGGTGALLSLVIPLAIFFLLMYFMIMRPQKKEQQRVKSMLAAMEVGDTVVTTSGFLRSPDQHYRGRCDRGIWKQQKLQDSYEKISYRRSRKSQRWYSRIKKTKQ